MPGPSVATSRLRDDGFTLLRQRPPLADDMTILGFEIVGAEVHLDFHSWHYHGYADDLVDNLKIRTNHYGLLPTQADARAVLKWLLSRLTDEAPKPFPWTAVALALPE